MPISLTQKNRYVLMRHGESLANRRGLIVSQPENALNSYGLTAQGAEQVMKTAIDTRLGVDTIVVTSDYKRTLETAEIMKSVIACTSDIIMEPLLRERNFGTWELSNHENYNKVWQNDMSHPELADSGVESIEQVLQRGMMVINKLDAQFNGQTILLIGHGDVLQILLSHYQNINPRFHRSLSSIGNAELRGLTRIEAPQPC